ncbi:YhfC family glutamic-type intramembrane protease [Chloroflexota bacterium]
MGEVITSFLAGWFVVPNVFGLGLALLFGAIWLAGYWPPLFKKHWLWAVMVASAFLSLAAVAFLQIPLQVLTGQLLGAAWSQEVIMQWLLLAGMPQILLSGLVQEGAKMVPIVVWRWRANMKLSPRMGLLIGAIAGAGFGVYEAVWAHTRIIAAGWTWQALQTDGLLAVAGFWERFFAVAFHIAASALVGYGLARGKWWQFYLIAAGLHALLNYAAVFLAGGFLTIIQLEIYVAVIAVLVTVAALRLRWRRTEELAESEI